MKPITLGAFPLLLVACSHPREPSAAADRRMDGAHHAAASDAATPQVDPSAPDRLVAMVQGTPAHPDLEGEVELLRTPGGVEVAAEFRGLPPGPHGWHVHVYGDCSDPANKSMGPHLDFASLGGGAPSAQSVITGDLGALVAGEGGTATAGGTVASLEPKDLGQLSGRAVVVHTGPNDPAHPPDGAAGPAIACGVLGVAPPEAEGPPEGASAPRSIGPGMPSRPEAPPQPPADPTRPIPDR